MSPKCKDRERVPYSPSAHGNNTEQKKLNFIITELENTGNFYSPIVRVCQDTERHFAKCNSRMHQSYLRKIAIFMINPEINHHLRQVVEERSLFHCLQGYDDYGKSFQIAGRKVTHCVSETTTAKLPF